MTVRLAMYINISLGPTGHRAARQPAPVRFADVHPTCPTRQAAKRPTADSGAARPGPSMPQPGGRRRGPLGGILAGTRARGAAARRQGNAATTPQLACLPGRRLAPVAGQRSRAPLVSVAGGRGPDNFPRYRMASEHGLRAAARASPRSPRSPCKPVPAPQASRGRPAGTGATSANPRRRPRPRRSTALLFGRNSPPGRLAKSRLQCKKAPRAVARQAALRRQSTLWGCLARKSAQYSFQNVSTKWSAYSRIASMSLSIASSAS